MESQYHEMSQVYDQLTHDQPYDSWFDIVNAISNQPNNILDIGCGTGSLTVKLQQLAPTTGMDLSTDMLAIAASKSNQVTWIEGDMTDFDLHTQFDVITIFCDSLNYLADENEVQATFENVYQHLSENGVFIFDVHTIHKMMTLFNNQSYIDETEDIFLAWEAVQGEVPYSVYHDMSFFIKQQDNTYHRFDESHYQRTLEEQVYRDILQQVGFKHIKTFTDFDMTQHSETAERLFFIAHK